MGIDAVDLTVELDVLVIQLIHISSGSIQGDFLHPVDGFQFLPGLFRNGTDTLGNGIPVHLIDIVILVELHCHHIVAGTDQIFLDLLIGALDGGHDGDDGGNADDDAQHGQHGAHLMAPDTLEGKTDIFFHSPCLLSKCTAWTGRSPPWERLP